MSIRNLGSGVIIGLMIQASIKLQKDQDAMKYTKELLKINIIRFNKGEIKQFDVLKSYNQLIALQLYNFAKDYDSGSSPAAMKTFKRLKLFNLNSMDPHDVLAAVEKEGYRKYFPIHQKIEGKESINPNYYHKHFSKNDWPEESLEKIKLFYVISELASLKGLTLEQRFLEGDKLVAEQWCLFSLMILRDVTMHLKYLEQSGRLEKIDKEDHYDDVNPCQQNFIDILSYEAVLCRTIYQSIFFSTSYPSQRKKIFTQLYPLLLENKRSASYYIGETFRGYPQTDEKLPLVLFCIKQLTAATMDGSPDPTITSQKDQMITFKNSLLIQKHFNPAMFQGNPNC